LGFKDVETFPDGFIEQEIKPLKNGFRKLFYKEE